uniref:Uncharacterized protein n=1 Tax=Lactuca sativa TaxID=4236 RepID=A0A9R1X325_LACSA|nr:hypothetical protein LSAT_V11C700369790 [Lactuca sativa]
MKKVYLVILKRISGVKWGFQNENQQTYKVARIVPMELVDALTISADLSRRLSQTYMSWMDFLMIMTLTNRIQKLLKKMNHGMIVLIQNLLSC